MSESYCIGISCDDNTNLVVLLNYSNTIDDLLRLVLSYRKNSLISNDLLNQTISTVSNDNKSYTSLAILSNEQLLLSFDIVLSNLLKYCNETNQKLIRIEIKGFHQFYKQITNEIYETKLYLTKILDKLSNNTVFNVVSNLTANSIDTSVKATTLLTNDGMSSFQSESQNVKELSNESSINNTILRNNSDINDDMINNLIETSEQTTDKIKINKKDDSIDNMTDTKDNKNLDGIFERNTSNELESFVIFSQDNTVELTQKHSDSSSNDTSSDSDNSTKEKISSISTKVVINTVPSANSAILTHTNVTNTKEISKASSSSSSSSSESESSDQSNSSSDSDSESSDNSIQNSSSKLLTQVSSNQVTSTTSKTSTTNIKPQAPNTRASESSSSNESSSDNDSDSSSSSESDSDTESDDSANGTETDRKDTIKSIPLKTPTNNPLPQGIMSLLKTLSPLEDVKAKDKNETQLERQTYFQDRKRLRDESQNDNEKNDTTVDVNTPFPPQKNRKLPIKSKSIQKENDNNEEKKYDQINKKNNKLVVEEDVKDDNLNKSNIISDLKKSNKSNKNINELRSNITSRSSRQSNRQNRK